MSDKCTHEWTTINGRVEGHGSLLTGVVQECDLCGALRFQYRERVDE